jgi:hypothetical protein
MTQARSSWYNIEERPKSCGTSTGHKIAPDRLCIQDENRRGQISYMGLIQTEVVEHA